MTTRAKYKNQLPQLDGNLFLTDGGLETTLIFHEGLDLPCFAAFVLLDSDRGRKALRDYFDRYVPMAIAAGAGFILESPTWRAKSRLGSEGRLRQASARQQQSRGDRISARPSRQVRDAGFAHGGERRHRSARRRLHCQRDDDGGRSCALSRVSDRRAARRQHDLVSAFTMTTASEAQGIAVAAKDANLPCAISFTVETDGRLPSGETLAYAIGKVDAATGNGPAYYMINCAHPTHFDHVLDAGAAWTKRIRGIRANSSRCSHAELDNAPELDIGDPLELGGQYAELKRRFPHINVLGGCCGTDPSHVDCISSACRRAA